ncbi:MAG TPA: YggU family protein [Epsilonproteobacteria bacterium]|nr:YggU family protein [Campylobacterota bacterium]
MFYEIIEDRVCLRIKAQPNASKSEFAGVYGEDAIKIRIKAPAVEGAANKELVKFLSKSFKVPKSDIILKTGQSSKIKIMEFPLTQRFQEWIVLNYNTPA